MIGAYSEDDQKGSINKYILQFQKDNCILTPAYILDQIDIPCSEISLVGISGMKIGN